MSIFLLMTACTDRINEVNEPLSVSTPVVSAVKSTSVKVSSKATGSHLISRGFCYSTSSSPTINDLKVSASSKQMELTLPWLDKNTTYYVRAYVQSSFELVYSQEVSFTTANADAGDDGQEEEQKWGPADLKRVSVHDPSVVYNPVTSTYYIFGSHRAAAKSPNLMSWEFFTPAWQTATSANANNNEAFTTPQVTTVRKGNETFKFEFNALKWSERGSDSFSIDGMMWAPDVIYNKNLRKWCMYLSINGDNWYSSVILLTADQPEGPYRYQAPVVIGGFSQYGTGNTDAYKDTDLEIVLGEQASLPARYNIGRGWGNRYPNCIDPCVFYDEDGKLWLSYGSWSGGIWMLELDENTGLRDYDVTYPLTGSGDNITIDPYFGKRIAGGHYVSGEASYIEYIGGYYYLFMTYGGLTADGGYQMRVFRSQNPDGPYVDSRGVNAAYTSYALNFGAEATDNRGVNIFGAYGDWGYQAVAGWAERSQGHNSAIAAEDGRAYLVYHSRFQGQGEGHAVRVHELYQNEDAWLVAAPFEYTGEVDKLSRIAKRQYVPTSQIPGNYKLLIHRYRLDNVAKELATPVDVTLNADGTISGAYTGKWSVREGTSYININIGSEYKGVMIEQTLEPTTEKEPSFTALNSATGVTIWGYKVIAKTE